MEETRQIKAIRIVTEYVKEKLSEQLGLTKELTQDDFYVVWFSKTIQNWKALVSTDAFSGWYFEVTYSGDKEETYLDIYNKHENVRVPD